MKYAKEFQKLLEAYPPEWVGTAMHYSDLKKCLKSVRKDLEKHGLDKKTLGELQAAGTSAEYPSAVRYSLDVTGSGAQRHFTVVIHVDNDAALYVPLSPESTRLLLGLAAKQAASREAAGPDDDDAPGHVVDDEVEEASVSTVDSSEAASHAKKIEVPLKLNDSFFRMIYADLAGLDDLQHGEQETMAGEIVNLGSQVARVTKPARFSKCDMTRWREIFELYLEAQIFFSTHERDHGVRSAEKAAQQLKFFEDEAERRNFRQFFKVPGSNAAYDQFLLLNRRMLQNYEFQEINRKALTKILKKFDKKTALGVSSEYLGLERPRQFMVQDVAKNLCAQMTTDVFAVVPRLEDYTCPVCLSLAWLPVRLKCHHIFCIRCVIKMQREYKRHCPLCRGNVVMQADLDNIDHDLVKFMRTYFRKESNEKQKANETERGIELFGESYKHSSCMVM